QRVVDVGADVAAALVQLAAGYEHPVAALELELQVVAGNAADRLGLEAREAGDAVVLVDHRGAGPQVGERGERSGSDGPRARLGAAAAQQPVLRQDRELERR